MTSFYTLLEKIKERPGMYLGRESITALFYFIEGYKYALMDAGIAADNELQEFRQFQPWLQKRVHITISASWAGIILLQSVDERDAFRNFFVFFDEFLTKIRKKKKRTAALEKVKEEH